MEFSGGTCSAFGVLLRHRAPLHMLCTKGYLIYRIGLAILDGTVSCFRSTSWITTRMN